MSKHDDPKFHGTADARWQARKDVQQATEDASKARRKAQTARDAKVTKSAGRSTWGI